MDKKKTQSSTLVAADIHAAQLVVKYLWMMI